MSREVVLDTETTGLDPRSGHRLVEIACVELRDLLPTGNTFHRYINPDRDIDPDAERIHGLSRHFLSDKPMFSDIVVGRGLLEFVGDSPIVAHNAAFDRGFVNHELSLAGLNLLPDARWIDSLALAQKRFPGMYNSLDALCKRFKISLAERDKHGALIDAQLLAGVYLELRGGREARLDLQHRRETKTSQSSSVSVEYGARPRPLQSRLTDSERQAHEAFIAEALKSEAVWRTRPQQA